MILYKDLDKRNEEDEIIFEIDSIIIPRIGEIIMTPIKDNKIVLYEVVNVIYEYKQYNDKVIREKYFHVYVTYTDTISK